jgi:hypothetical protein
LAELARLQKNNKEVLNYLSKALENNISLIENRNFVNYILNLMQSSNEAPPNIL